MKEFDLGLSALRTDDGAARPPDTSEQVAMARTPEKRDAPKPPAEQSAKASKPGRPALWIVVGTSAALLAVLALVVLSGQG